MSGEKVGACLTCGHYGDLHVGIAGPCEVCARGVRNRSHVAERGEHDDCERFTPEPSEVAETTAGERECRYPCGCDQFPDEHCTCMDGHTPAEPDADEREALADLIWNNTDEPMWSAMVLAEQFMRSPWLAAHVSAAENKARADERERIAEAIEDHADQSAPRHTRRALTFAASIARGDAR